jgi:hypothetical protein
MSTTGGLARQRLRAGRRPAAPDCNGEETDVSGSAARQGKAAGQDRQAAGEDGQLITGLDSELRAALVDQLARQG